MQLPDRVRGPLARRAADGRAVALPSSTALIAARIEASGGFLPALPKPVLSTLLVAPLWLRPRLIARVLRHHPLPGPLESELVAEVSECWDGVPLPATLPTLIDQSRRLDLLAAVEAPSAAHDGPERIGRTLRFTKLQPLEQRLRGGDPVCVLTASFGAWRHIAPAFARRGYETALLDLRPAAQRSQVAPPGVTLFATDGYARPLVRWLSEGPRVLVALADEGCGPRWASGTLLGRAVSVGSTPFELARRIGMPLIPVFPIRLKSVHQLVFEPELRLSDTGRGDQDLDTTAGRFLKLLDRNARRHPQHYLGTLLRRRLRRDSDPMPFFASPGGAPPRKNSAPKA